MGIQVNPEATTRYAMARFGEDYTKLVMQCSDLSAFAEAGQNEVARLERQAKVDLDTIAGLEALVNEGASIKTQLQAEVQSLQAQLAEFRPADDV